jgi:hypothetical protein
MNAQRRWAQREETCSDNIAEEWLPVRWEHQGKRLTTEELKGVHAVVRRVIAVTRWQAVDPVEAEESRQQEDGQQQNRLQALIYSRRHIGSPDGLRMGRNPRLRSGLLSRLMLEPSSK